MRALVVATRLVKRPVESGGSVTANLDQSSNPASLFRSGWDRSARHIVVTYSTTHKCSYKGSPMAPIGLTLLQVRSTQEMRRRFVSRSVRLNAPAGSVCGRCLHAITPTLHERWLRHPSQPPTESSPASKQIRMKQERLLSTAVVLRLTRTLYYLVSRGNAPTAPHLDARGN